MTPSAAAGRLAWILFGLALPAVPANASSSTAELLPGWALAGPPDADYEAHRVPDGGRGGSAAIELRATSQRPDGYGAILQTVRPDSFRPGRWRMTAWARCRGEGLRGGLWLSADASDRKGLAFDNMEPRPIRECGDWGRYEIVFEVPAEASQVSFGVWLQGPGRLRVDDFQFEPVPDTVPTSTWPLLEPHRLDFDDAVEPE